MPTVSYQLDNLISPTVPLPSGTQPLTQSSIIGLSNGGFAVVTQDDQGFSDLNIYNAAGVVTASNLNFDATDAKVIQLSNGHILVAGNVGNTVDYRIFDLDGNVVGAGPIDRITNISNVSLTATAGGGWAAAVQQTISATDHNIVVDVRTSENGAPTRTVIDSSNADDQDPSIAALTGGGFGLASDRTDHSGGATDGNTAMVFYGLNADGSANWGASDAGGSINRQPSVTARIDGGFTVTYEDNGWSGTQSDITEEDFNANGSRPAYNEHQLTNDSSPDSQAASATLSGGVIVTAYTEVFLGADLDLYLTAVDPVTGAKLLSENYFADSGRTESLSAIAALANNRFAVVYTDDSSTDLKIYQIVRTTDGDITDDVLTGDTLFDNMYGGLGNDTFTPGGGADNYVEGDQGYDTVVFSGARAGYTVNRDGLTTTVSRLDGGADTLSAVEKLQFTDGNVYTPDAARDMNGDGNSDMVLRNTATGDIRVWTMNSDGTLGSTDKTTKTPTTNWTLVGTGQFNFATDSYDDILMQNTNNNTLQVYEMNGFTVTATVALGALNTGWQAVTTGDFDGDGQSDIVMVDTTGQVKIWMMNGTTATSKVNVGASGYQVVDTGDFNGDGKSDILVVHNGQFSVWLMNGTTRLENDKISTLLPTGYQAISSGDFNGDGKSDILLWNSSTGSVKIWEMNGSAIIGNVTVGTSSAGYHVTGSGDFNGDGNADIVFQKTDGHVQEWLMNGTTITSKITVGSPGSAWTLLAGTGG